MRSSAFGLLCVLVASLPVCAWSQTADETVRPGIAAGGWEWSADEGSTWAAAAPAVPGGQVKTLLARAAATVQPEKDWVAFELAHNVSPECKFAWTLNGQDVPLPLEGMVYKSIPAIPITLLKAGRNELQVKVTFDNKPKSETDTPAPITPRIEASIVPVKAADLKMVTGPILGAATPTSFSVTCRTNLPVPVTLSLRAADGTAPIVKTSQTSLFHRFVVDGLKAQAGWTYSLSVDKPPYKLAAAPARPVVLAPTGDKFSFVMLGDCRSRPTDWATVSAAVAKLKPAFLVFNGDMTACGRYDWLWDEQFYAPAAELLSTAPFYPIMGNHEENAPVYPKLFHTPGGDGMGKNWFQRIGPVLLICYDTQWSLTRDKEFPGWLANATADQAGAGYIFYLTHYPAWTMGKGTTVDPQTNLPKHSGSRFAREEVQPRLEKLKATAMFTSHEHLYERSELPSGLTHIVSGGAGAPRGQKGEEAPGKQYNPYSKLLEPVLHFCVIEVDGASCTMKVLSPGGKEIDTRTWPARKR